MKAATSSVLVALAACRGSSHDAPQDLTARIEQVRAAEHLPALGMAVWRHGELVASAVTGTRKAGDATRVTFDDRWHLGSDTKAMTATLVGIYVDRGVLHWNDSLGKLFAGVTIDPQFADVTLDQLLQHRGGLPAHEPADVLAQEWADGKAPDARAKYVAAILGKPPAQPPGTYVYANASFVVAGAALERATGKPWEQLIRDDLWTPLHMTSCGFGAPTGDSPWGHRRHGDELEPMSPELALADNPPALGPAGTVHCTLADWGKFLAIHAAPSTPLVSAQTMAHLHAGPHYSGGWLIYDIAPGDRRYAHEGSNTMWHAIALVVPARDEAIAIVANVEDDHLFEAMTPIVQTFLR